MAESPDELDVIDWRSWPRCSRRIGAADIAALEKLYTEDYVLELPYAERDRGGRGSIGGPGPCRRRSRAPALHAHRHRGHPSADPDLVIAEYTSEGAWVATGAPYRNRYIGLWWFRDGKVCRTREFYNPPATSSTSS